MGMLFRFVVVLSGGVLCSVYAADWPHWTGPEWRNAADETNLPSSFDRKSGEHVRWVAELGEVVFGCPTVAGGRVYVGTNMAALRDDGRFDGAKGGVLVCLDEGTGERLWALAAPERTEGLHPRAHMIHQRWGICSSPTADRDRVYVVTNGDDLLCLDVLGQQNGNGGPFLAEAAFIAGEGNPPVALRADDGDILWRYDIPRKLEVAPHDVASSSVLVHGDGLYLATSNGIGAGSPVYALNREAPGFIAVGKDAGNLLAREAVGLSEKLFHAQWGSATLAQVGARTLILLGGNDGVCYAFEALPDSPVGRGETPGPLKLAWSFDCNPPHYQRGADGKPIYYYQGDLRVYKRKVNNGEATEGFNAGDGAFIGPNEILASPVYADGRVYVATGRDPLHGLARGMLTCIDASGDGDITESGLVWRFEGIGRSLSTVALADGLVYAADLAGWVYCLDAESGALYWRHDTGSEIWGNPLVADGKVYVNSKGAFWIFAAGREKEVLFTSRGGSACGAIAANGVVFVVIRGGLYALTLKGEG